MKVIFKKITTVGVLVFLGLVSVQRALAQPAGGTVPGAGSPAGGTVPTNSGLSYELKNPLAFNSIESLIIAILNVLIVILTPIVVIFIILAGFKYVTARGNPAKIQEATNALTFAIIGGVLIIGAVVIAEIIKDLVTSFRAQ